MVSGEGLTYLNLFVLNYQWLMIFALPLILMYNGERGLNNKFIKLYVLCFLSYTFMDNYYNISLFKII